MSNPTDKPSLRTRLRPHVPAFVAGALVGAVIVIKFHPRMKPIGDVLLHPALAQQIKDHGQAVVELAQTGQIVDIIDWGHPLTAHLSK